MIPSVRYFSAFVVNVALPMLAYRLALPHHGLLAALVVSSLPVFAWMAVDFARFRHVDALSAMVLSGIALSLLVLVSAPGRWLFEVRDPAVSGVLGALFVVSLLLRRPLVFYLARSTLAREHQDRAAEFDLMWCTRPALRRSIRLMTAVWGIGLVGENVARVWIDAAFADHGADRLSACVRYAVYGGLTIWTIVYRRMRIQRQRS